MNKLSLTSPVFENGGKIPQKYTCDGEDISPPLVISNIPERTASLALVMDDPDAAQISGKVWDHWIVWNIPADTNKIPEGKEPKGILGTGTGGNQGYQGPCPPDRPHTYRFKVYALDTVLELQPGATKKELETAIQDHILEEAEIKASYQRSQT